MKKLILFAAFVLVTAMTLSLLSCGNGENGNSDTPQPPAEEHTHVFDVRRVGDTYLKSVADCTNPASYFYSCTCGEAGTKAFLEGKALEHSFDVKSTDAKYLKSAASCQSPAVYYYSCLCGAVSEASFEHGDIASHEYNQKNTDEKYCKTPATCMAAGLYYYSCKCGATNGELFHGTSLGKHVYDQQVVKDKYLCSPANSNTAALYYYSCKCGDAGTEVFKHASASPAGWTSVSKTVYGIVQGGCIRFEAKDSAMVKLIFDFGQAFSAVSTNGTWYKISMGGSDYGYVRCSHVTDKKGTVTFTDVSMKYTDAVVPDGKTGVYLQTDMIGTSSIFVTYEASHNGYISVLEMNQTGDWVKVRFHGYDSNGGYHEAKTVFYCQTKDLFLRPW